MKNWDNLTYSRSQFIMFVILNEHIIHMFKVKITLGFKNNMILHDVLIKIGLETLTVD